MSSIISSPFGLAFSAAVTLIAVIVGAMLAAWARRDVADRNLKTHVAISLFNEFHAPSFIRYRHTAHRVLTAPDANGFVDAFYSCDEAEQDALTTLVHFFEKVAVLWAQDKVDKRLIIGFLGVYIRNYGQMLFDDSGADEADRMWGDLMVSLKFFIKKIEAEMAAA